MQKPDLTLAGMPNWRAFAVYGWRRNERYLYIGVTAKGYRRPFYNHDVIDKADDVREGDHFDFWFFPNREVAASFESAMIALFQPSYNKSFPKGTSSPKERRCSECAYRIPKSYKRTLCGNCERLKIWKVANRAIRQVKEEWTEAHESNWSDRWDIKYSCEERRCARCEVLFLQKQWWQSFCSPECESPTVVLGQPDGPSVCAVCKLEKIPLYEGNCMDCLNEDQRAEFDAIMAQFKIVKRKEIRQ